MLRTTRSGILPDMSAFSRGIEEGLAHHRAGQWDAAEALYREILAADANHADALHLLALVAMRKGQLDEAIDLAHRSVAIRPLCAQFHSDLAMILAAAGRLADAVVACQQAADLEPKSAKIICNLGNALQLAGQVDEAIAKYRQALALEHGDAKTRNNLGEAYKRKSLWDAAVNVFRELLRDRPDMFEAHLNLGGALQARGDLDEAIGSFLKGIELNPTSPVGYTNLAGAYKDAGRLDEAIALQERALQLCPDARTASARLFLLHYHPGHSAADLHSESRQWYERYVHIMPAFVRDSAARESSRTKLRIGYVSPDFHDHPVAYNLLRLLANHDHDQFEIFCYSNTFDTDDITARLKACVDHWLDVTGLDDGQVADAIHADGIDILVDLALHTGNNRLLVFARKPAPIQVAFAGYPGTTGLPTIDYRLTDPYLDPPGQHDEYYTEQTYRLPDTFWCYDPAVQGMDVNPLPALEAGHVTFGCLNNFCKVTDQVLSLWARVLERVPKSRLLLLSKRGAHRQRTVEFLAAQGVDRRAVEFVDPQPREQYFRTYHRIDIGLDTFPYNGHTTSLDCYWMGVPVVTLVGRTIVGRAGFSQLSNLGLDQFVAETTDKFVQIAVQTAADLPNLAQLRRTLRERTQSSPLMDGKRFAKAAETAYRWMWEH